MWGPVNWSWAGVPNLMLFCGAEYDVLAGDRDVGLGGGLVCDLSWTVGGKWFPLLSPVHDSRNK